MILLIENLLEQINSHGIVAINYEYHDHNYKKHEENNKQEVIWFKELSNYYYPELLDFNNVQTLSIKAFEYGRFGWEVEYVIDNQVVVTNLNDLK